MNDDLRLDPRVVMEEKYALPYHWFPAKRIRRFDRQELSRLIFRLIDTHAPRPISHYLDLGCGDGRWTSDIHDHLNTEPTTVGIDVSARAIGFARLICPVLSFEVERVENLPFDDASFDLITAIEVLEHLPDGIEELALREARRVLRPDGLLMVTTPTWNLRLSPHHFRHYAVERLHELLNEASFEVLETRGHARPCYGWQRRLRGFLNQFPKLWKLGRYYHRETDPGKALTALVAARPRAARVGKSAGSDPGSDG